MKSRWVKSEYTAFFSHCHFPGQRRLVPLLTQGFQAKDLHLFLREFQVGRIEDEGFIQGLIQLLGGVNIEKLQAENQMLREQLENKQAELTSALEGNRVALEKIRELNERQEESNKTIKELKPLLAENLLLKEQILDLLSRQDDVSAVKGARMSPQDSSSPVTGLTSGPLKKSSSPLEGHREEPGISPKPAPPQEREKPSWPITKGTLYVSNLSYKTRDWNLAMFFSKAGLVLHAQIITNRRSMRSLGYGYVEMQSHDQALAALQLHGKELDESCIAVELALGV